MVLLGLPSPGSWRVHCPRLGRPCSRHRPVLSRRLSTRIEPPAPTFRQVSPSTASLRELWRGYPVTGRRRGRGRWLVGPWKPLTTKARGHPSPHVNGPSLLRAPGFPYHLQLPPTAPSPAMPHQGFADTLSGWEGPRRPGVGGQAGRVTRAPEGEVGSWVVPLPHGRLFNQLCPKPPPPCGCMGPSLHPASWGLL